MFDIPPESFFLKWYIAIASVQLLNPYTDIKYKVQQQGHHTAQHQENQFSPQNTTQKPVE